LLLKEAAEKRGGIAMVLLLWLWEEAITDSKHGLRINSPNKHKREEVRKITMTH
jgi:hypothetical protein